ncbi:MAG: hypothetical protein HC888_15170 [Candidatus Competibacteraceae bacterium]|nr:hypothetical protein [Candidatus Competibacteraceae bacterium]
MKVHIDAQTGYVPLRDILAGSVDRTDVAFMYEGHVYGFIRKGGQTCPVQCPNNMIPVINFKQMSCRSLPASTQVFPVDVTINVKGLPQ